MVYLQEEWAIIVERKGWWDGTDRNKHWQKRKEVRAENGHQKSHRGTRMREQVLT